jgi:hypothetical protein
MEDPYSKNISDLSLTELANGGYEAGREFYRRNTTGFHWGPEPNYRGSSTILRSTIITMVMVLWRLVNVDVYASAKSWQRTLYNAVWLVSAIISPATVTLYARKQLREARDVYKSDLEAPRPEMNSVQQPEDDLPVCHHHVPPNTPKNINRYSPLLERGLTPDELKMNGAFLVISGGFAYDNGGEGGGMIISPSEFKRLLAKGLIESLAHDSEEIEDKQTGDTFAKIVIAVQLCSALIQLISRELAPLPVTPLEGYSYIVIFTGFLTYLYWLNKPFGVRSPVKLRVTNWDKWRPLWVEENINRRPQEDSYGVLDIFKKHIEVLRDPEDLHYIYAVLRYATSCLSSWGIASDIIFFTDIERLVWRVWCVGVASPLLLSLSQFRPEVRESIPYKFLFLLICPSTFSVPWLSALSHLYPFEIPRSARFKLFHGVAFSPHFTRFFLGFFRFSF